ncbi:LysR family transcriptional regulator [Halomonas sp. PAMB 3264]|uniref:LysR family transcriptional regulator n=1 Tax=unclassified Halomonas TaxID=2609666 RepID=UPI0028A1C106|nr:MULTISPECIES: LysR family transcriptional regulator [unclassified Halomonas]WNL38098.1 LysR family transcriptional regulator [Halomonas sp. PAMB 3232]WNL41424.1 LysR family transcriptional regulator [Halomonas sp. PAMB 3264]
MMKLRYSFRQLQIFQEVARTASLSKAARRLDLTQPAVSTAIANLEQEAGFLLFRRNHYGTELTPEAKHLAEGVDKVLSSVRHLEELSDLIGQGHSGKLTIGCMPGLSPTVIPRTTSAYLAEHEASRLSLQTFSTPKIAEWVSEGQFDLGVIEAESDLPELSMTRYQLRMHLAVPTSSELASFAELSPEQLYGQNLITLDENHQSTAKLKHVLLQANVPFRRGLEVHLFSSAIALVNEELGVALVDPVTAHGFLKRRDCQVTMVPFAPHIDLDIAVVTSRFHALSRQCQGFLPYLHANLTAWQTLAQSASPWNTVTP